MLVYGKLERLEPAAEVHASVESALLQVVRMPSGLDRHAALVGAFIRAAELAQGIADAEFETRGWDAQSPSQQAGAVLLLNMGEAIDRSWNSGFQSEVDARTFLRLLRDVDCKGFIKTRLAEGYAHYGLYPESYLAAARGSRLAANTCVIGIRSIGIGLAAIIAAALGAAPAISLRPVGHPFDREIRAAPGLLGGQAADPDVHFAIADEGPGKSGSSFASVARWLLGCGVTADRIHFFPSHDGQPGSAAGPEIHSIWHDVRRHPASPDAFLIHGASGLQNWLEAKIGPLKSPLREIRGDSFCSKRIAHDDRFTRRKFIARNAEASWLIKFAGIGAVGERKFRDAAAIADSGFGPEAATLCYGFLVQKWVKGQPVIVDGCDRIEFLRTLGLYLRFRATHLGPPGTGASVDALRTMAIHNVSQALGCDLAATLERRLTGLASCEDRIRRVRTDNRLHAWEWLKSGQGILKLDAVDHCEGHDLIGCQDITWDVAGACVEYDLTDTESAELFRTVSAAGGPGIDGGLVAALLPCYLAFHLGLWSTATPSSSGTEALAASYGEKLSRCLRRRSL